mgnify:CR=1 FL=1|jgi:hypothetical protein
MSPTDGAVDVAELQLQGGKIGTVGTDGVHVMHVRHQPRRLTKAEEAKAMTVRAQRTHD